MAEAPVPTIATLVAQVVQYRIALVAPGIAVIPPGGVKHLALKLLESRNPRHFRGVDRSQRHDDEPRS